MSKQEEVTVTATIRINDWPKREFMTFERTRIDDVDRWLTEYPLNNWDASITPKEKQNPFVQMTALKVTKFEGKNEYVFREKARQAVVAVIIVERIKIDEIEIYAEWFESANMFVHGVFIYLCNKCHLPHFFDWMKPAKQEQAIQEQSPAKQDSSQKKATPRGMKLGTAERVTEFHHLVKSNYSHRDAKKHSHCDPSTYYQWCKEVTGEEPIVPYR